MSQSSIEIGLLQYLSEIIQWLYPLSILASWGVFNNGF